MKKIISILMALVIVFGCFGYSPFNIKANAASSRMETAIQWAINIANDNSHGYSQSSRWGPDYDCSSFVISALKYAGYDVGSATYTGNMKSNLESRGFTWIPWSQVGSVNNLQRGDILLNEASHTELYIGNSQNVAASSSRGNAQSGDQDGTEIWVRSYWYDNWDGILRENVEDVPTNVGIHAWVATSPMGGCPDTYNVGDYFYLCYELINIDTGEKIGDCGLNYTVTETIYDTNGNIAHTHQDYNDNNYIGLRMDKTGTYIGKICVTGDLNLEQTVSCTVNAAPSLSLSYKFIGFDLADEVYSKGVTATISVPGNALFDIEVDSNLFTYEFGELKETNGIFTVPITIKTTKKIGSCTAKAKLTSHDNPSELLAEATIGLATFCSNDYGDWIVETQPTCVKNGMRKRICRHCGNVETEVLTATGDHSFGNWTVTKEPTKTSEGERVRYCKVCNKKETQSIPKIAAISNLKVTPGKTTAKLTWGKNTSAKYYRVYSVKNGKFTQLTQTANNSVLSYTVKNLVPSASYTYRVIAFNSSNKSIASSDITTKTLSNIGNLKVSPGKTTAKLTWAKNPNATSYKILVKKNGAFTTVGTTSSGAYTVKSLVPSANHTLRVSAYNASGKMIGYSDITTKTLSNIGNLKVTPGKTTAKLTWSRNPNANYYKTAILKNGVYTTLKTAASNSCSLSGLTPSANYTLRVSAFDTSDRIIGYSDITTKTLSNIGNLTITPYKNSATLKWSKNPNATSYRVLIQKNGTYTTYAMTTGGLYTVKGLSANTTYILRVSAYNASGKMIGYSDITAKTKSS